MDTPGPEPLIETALDREIRAALNVEPSTAFVARVRQRIAREPVRPAWYRSWNVGATAAVAIVVVMALIVRIERGSLTTVGPTQQPSVIESRTPAGIPELQPTPSVVSGFRRPTPSVVSGFSRTSQTRSVVSFSRTRTTPEILIDAREAAALRALFAGASLGNVDLVPLADAAAKAASDLTPPEEIVVAPLVNEPLTPVPGEGARP
jgi:hypothetical protein